MSTSDIYDTATASWTTGPSGADASNSAWQRGVSRETLPLWWRSTIPHDDHHHANLRSGCQQLEHRAFHECGPSVVLRRSDRRHQSSWRPAATDPPGVEVNENEQLTASWGGQGLRCHSSHADRSRSAMEPNNFGNPGGANYFDVTVAANPITVTSLDINTAETVAF